MDLLLIVVLLILAGFGLHGYIRGLVRVVFSLVAVILTIGLATAAAPYAEHVLQEQTPVDRVVKDKCTAYLQSVAEEEIQKKAENQKSIYIFGLRMPDEVQGIIAESAAGQAGNLIKESGVYEEIGEFVAGQIVQRLAWVLSFMVVLFLLMIAVHILDVIAKLPVLKNINRIGGLVVGLFEGLVIVWILLLAIVLCQGTEFGREMMGSVEGNMVLEFLYENNLLEQFILG